MIKVDMKRVNKELNEMAKQYEEINIHDDVTVEIIELNNNLVSACSELQDMLYKVKDGKIVDMREIKKIANTPKATYGRYIYTVSNWLASNISEDRKYDARFLNSESVHCEIR